MVEGMKSWRSMLPELVLVLLVAVIAVLSLIMVVSWLQGPPPENPNALAIGKLAKFHGAREIAINPPIELDWKSKADVLAIRKHYVYQHPELLANGTYTPFPEVFGQIVDGRPWWGLAGEYYYGSGNASVRGPSEESRFIANPYLLVAADFGKVFGWNRKKITKEELSKPDFPFVCLPNKMLWDPAQKHMDVWYPVNEHVHKVFQVNGWDWQPSPRPFFHAVGVIAYNARDFNFNYLQIVPGASQNLGVVDMRPMLIPQFIHTGGSCGYPGGCNNMSPSVRELDNIRILQLPATIKVHLWHDKPRSAEQEPDMTCTIHLQ